MSGLTALNGAFAWITKQPTSRYSGIFFKIGKQLTRVIEHMSFFAHVRSFSWKDNVLSCELPDGVATITFTNQSECVIALPKKRTFDIFLDCKEIYDDRSWGRYYATHTNGPLITTYYRKTNDEREAFRNVYEFYVHFKDLEVVELKQQFVEHVYAFDKERNAEPFSRWVYELGRFSGKTFSIALSAKKTYPKVRSVKHHKESLHTLQHSKDGIAAGYPWFFESWTRDELICVQGLYLSGAKQIATNIVKKYCDVLKKNFIFSSKYPKSNLAAADGMGWLCMRIEQAIEHHFDSKFFNSRRKKQIAEIVSQALERLWKNRGKNGLIYNQPLETWMDTGWNGDVRDGFCIEIQALTLAMHRLVEELSGQRSMKKTQFMFQVQQSFVKDGKLLDRLDDDAVRPNVALAYYLVPELFTRSEWEVFFDHALEKLWLEWGGVSSINKDHPLFCEMHTGSDNKSYHRGDSWFWINHYFALALKKINPKKYKPYIDKICEASTQVQELGVSGYIPELSSAKQLEARGCLAQAWSDATWIELWKR